MQAPNSKQIQIAVGVVNAQLVDPTRDLKLRVSEILSYEVEGAQFVTGRPGWDGRTSMFSFSSNRFPSGFVALVKSVLEKEGWHVRLIEKPCPEPLGPEKPVVDAFPEDPRYDYQPETVHRLIKYRRMIARVATGGGKSRIARLAYARINRTTLFLTTRKTLMYQMADSFKSDLKVRVGILGDSSWEPCNGFNCATVDTISSRIEVKTRDSEITKIVQQLADELESKIVAATKIAGIPYGTLAKFATAAQKAQTEKIRAALKAEQSALWPTERIGRHVESIVRLQAERRRDTIAFLERVEFVILEEAHEVSGTGFFDVMNACKNAHYRLALTATPFMKDSAEANMRLMAVTGLVGIKVSEKLLIDRGILAKPCFRFITPQKPPKISRSSDWSRAYKLGIVESQMRNATIVYEAKRAAQYGLTTMVLVQHTKHGDVLEDMLRTAGLRVAFIRGDDNQPVRKKALVSLEKGEIDVLIGTTILDVGVDVPAVGMIVLAGGGKAEVALRQRIGRGLRAKKVGPNVCLIVDFHDDSNNHLIKHSRQRRQIVEDTPGFVEGILPDGSDFNYTALGFKKAA